MAKPKKVTVTFSEIIGQLCVEVHGKEGRAKVEYVVYLSRQEAIKGGYQFAPEDGYRAPDDIPAEVKTAAIETYAKRFDRTEGDVK